MIVAMRKAYVAARRDDRDALLAALRELGVVHLRPADPSRAVADERLRSEIDRFRRAAQLLAQQEPAQTHPPLPAAAEVVEETLKIQRDSTERKARLGALHRRLNELAMWGELRLSRLRALREAGVDLRFYSVPTDAVDAVAGECVQVLGELQGGRRALVAVVTTAGEPTVCEEAELLEPPARDRPSIRAEAAELDEALREDGRRLRQLAGAADEIDAALVELQARARFSEAMRGGLAAGELYCVQGWVPADRADDLAEGLARAGVDAGVQTFDPPEDEEPPTLIRYPRWARPIKGLFDILGTVPGYREMDLSPFFMVALPLFAAMLIGDAGYGAIFLLVALAFYGKLTRAAGRVKTHLLLTLGGATLVWGVLTANYFGVTPVDAGEPWGSLMAAVGVLWNADPETARFTIIKVSFLIGCVHLILAHVRSAAAYWPDRKALSEIGWCLVLAGMLGVIWKLFRFAMPPWLVTAAMVCVAAGAVLAVGFAYPHSSLGKRIGAGLASSLLPLLGTFSDTMSYIRLMAVGLASYYIANAFNLLGAMVASSSPVLWVVGVPVIVFGHALNIGLALIAIFAHGVRLNMLEFSNNAGVQWAGYPYQPFAEPQDKES